MGDVENEVLCDSEALEAAASAVRLLEGDNANMFAEYLEQGLVELCGTDDQGYSWLILASHFNALGCLKILLDAGVDPDWVASDGSTALVVACIAGHRRVAQTLLAYGASPNAIRGSPTSRRHISLAPVFFTAQEGHVGMLLDLLDYRADPNVLVCKATPLYIAVQENHPQIVKLLLKTGADPNLPTKQLSATPLVMAVHRRRPAILKWLLERGADPNWVTERGTTPLLAAIDRKNTSAIPILLEYGASIVVGCRYGGSGVYSHSLIRATNQGKHVGTCGCGLGVVEAVLAAGDTEVARQIVSFSCSKAPSRSRSPSKSDASNSTCCPGFTMGAGAAAAASAEAGTCAGAGAGSPLASKIPTDVECTLQTEKAQHFAVISRLRAWLAGEHAARPTVVSSNMNTNNPFGRVSTTSSSLSFLSSIPPSSAAAATAAPTTSATTSTTSPTTTTSTTSQATVIP
eukprot:INCI20213.1.p1 GENE.INCI20213.1~~INCI20213.1.p1  ORF type:complete len:460 (+),score=72.13 INCI20213.1:801-2180(+)